MTCARSAGRLLMDLRFISRWNCDLGKGWVEVAVDVAAPQGWGGWISSPCGCFKLDVVGV